MAETQIMGAAINGIINALSSKIILNNFTRKKELDAINDNDFYSLSLYNELVAFLESSLGKPTLFKVGKAVGKAIVDHAFSKSVTTVKEGIAEIQKAHQIFCKPIVGAFKIIEEGDDFIKLQYDAPYNCILQEGLFFEVASKYGKNVPKVSHTKCKRDGGSSCSFEIKF